MTNTITLTADMLGLTETHQLFDADVVALVFRQAREDTALSARHSQAVVRLALVKSRERRAS